MHFGVTEKPTMDCVSVYNNSAIVSKFYEEIANEIAENCRCLQPHCCLTPPPQGTPRISPQTLYCQKL